MPYPGGSRAAQAGRNRAILASAWGEVVAFTHSKTLRYGKLSCVPEGHPRRSPQRKEIRMMTQQPALSSIVTSATHVRRLHRLRLSLAFFALLDVAAHLFANPGATPIVSYWIDIETASYGLIAVIYLLGLRQYYGPPVIFTAYNMAMFFLSGITALPFGINKAPLAGHLAFLHYSFGRGFSLAAWLYLLLVGLWMLRRDPGSKLNDLLKES